MPNLPVQLTPADVVKRTRSMIGRGSYKLGAGGRVPREENPFNEQNECDCSGFAAWCLGVDRYQPDKINGDEDWIETSAIVRDAKGPAESFFIVNGARRPSDLIVYPDRTTGNVRRQGHVGVITEVDSKGKVTKVTHCASSNRPRAIQETPPDLFLQRGAIVVRFRGLIEQSGKGRAVRS